MSHDPKAPRLAAIATLVAGSLLVFSAVNLYFDFFGATGISLLETWSVVGAAIASIIARFANEEHPVPELVNSPIQIDDDQFLLTRTRETSKFAEQINPTTATIITRILGDAQQTDSHQVASAIDTLTSGAFGASVLSTMLDSRGTKANNANRREATPADETTGLTLHRVHVQPVPLPGKENEPVVDPKQIPGLEPNRIFLRDGMASVPLPNASSTHSAPAVAQIIAPLPLQDDFSSLLSEVSSDAEIGASEDDAIEDGEALEHTPHSTHALPELPDLPEHPSVAASPAVPAAPALPASTAVPAVPTYPDSAAVPAAPALPAAPTLPASPASPETPALPELPDLPELEVDETESTGTPVDNPAFTVDISQDLPEMVLPNLDDLFADMDLPPSQVVLVPATPDLPNLDDLF